MPLFLSATERAALAAAGDDSPVTVYRSALAQRAKRRAGQPGLVGSDTTTQWWYAAADYLSDAAMHWALSGDEAVGRWLREVTLGVARASEDDWIGPFFRDHQIQPRIGHLETAHLAWGVAVVLDLARDLFTPGEQQEIAAVLAERAIPLCLAWFDVNPQLANWRCIMTSGVAVPAAVLDLQPAIARAVAEFQLSTEIFQPDGSYGESVQYANYAACGLALSREALVRRNPTLAAHLPIAPYARAVRWFAASHLYHKPLPGWGERPRPRAANFNDAAAIFRPSGDVLAHIAACNEPALAAEAGLARWLLDELYSTTADDGPWDRASFGLVNHFGFLTLPLLPQAAPAQGPREAGLSTLSAFSNGDVLCRQAWPGQTILAMRTGGEPLHGPGHLHGDLNSFILAHRHERLLVDAGHSCYRNLIHELEGSTQTHNTCTFAIEAADSRPVRHEEIFLASVRQQQRKLMRRHHGGQLEPPADRGARRLLAIQSGALAVVASEAAPLYGPPLEAFTRVWLMAGENIVWVVDRIRAAQPVKPIWNWLLNNRDGRLELDTSAPCRMLALRPLAGLAMFRPSDATVNGPLYAFVHDAYHTLPAQLGEGRTGSGWLLREQSAQAIKSQVAVHALAVDEPGQVDKWQLETAADRWTLHCDGRERSRLEIDAAPLTLRVGFEGRRWEVVEREEGWRVTATA